MRARFTGHLNARSHGICQHSRLRVPGEYIWGCQSSSYLGPQHEEAGKRGGQGGNHTVPEGLSSPRRAHCWRSTRACGSPCGNHIPDPVCSVLTDHSHLGPVSENGGGLYHRIRQSGSPESRCPPPRVPSANLLQQESPAPCLKTVQTDRASWGQARARTEMHACLASPAFSRSPHSLTGFCSEHSLHGSSADESLSRTLFLEEADVRGLAGAGGHGGTLMEQVYQLGSMFGCSLTTENHTDGGFNQTDDYFLAYNSLRDSDLWQHRRVHGVRAWAPSILLLCYAYGCLMPSSL